MKTLCAFAAVLLWLIFCQISFADWIQYIEYEACYMAVPIRDAPGPRSIKIGEIPKGVRVRISDQKAHWVKVTTWADPNNKDKGYIVGWAASTAMCPIK